MSGGHFDYKQFNILTMIEQLEQDLMRDEYMVDADILPIIKDTIISLKKSYAYVHALDYYLSCDYGKESLFISLNESFNDIEY